MVAFYEAQERAQRVKAVKVAIVAVYFVMVNSFYLNEAEALKVGKFKAVEQLQKLLTHPDLASALDA